MKTSKIIFAVFACLFFVGRTFAQQIGYDSVKELDKRLVEFTAVLEMQVNRMEGSNLKKTARAAAKVLKHETKKVLRKIETEYPADDNYVLNAVFDNALAQDIQSFAPATASFLRTRATITLIEGGEREIAARPEYYRVLINIKKFSGRLNNSTGFRQVKLYTEMLKIEHRNLKELMQ